MSSVLFVLENIQLLIGAFHAGCPPLAFLSALAKVPKRSQNVSGRNPEWKRFRKDSEKYRQKDSEEKSEIQEIKNYDCEKNISDISRTGPSAPAWTFSTVFWSRSPCCRVAQHLHHSVSLDSIRRYESLCRHTIQEHLNTSSERQNSTMRQCGPTLKQLFWTWKFWKGL